MTDDFNAPEPFRKGKAKVQSLKPWQAMVDEQLVDKPRCWDGTNGCEEYKFKGEFRWHPRICDRCAQAMCNRFGVPMSEAEMLALLLAQDAGLFRSARYLHANPDKVTAMEKGREVYIPELFRSIRAAGANSKKIETANKAYRDWFHASLEIEVTPPKHAQGFTSVATALPVGDRA